MAIFMDVTGDIEQKPLHAEPEAALQHLSECDMAALVDVAVLEPQRSVFLAHLAGCRNCRRILSGAILSQSFISDPD
jgi:hypothetical protein